MPSLTESNKPDVVMETNTKKKAAEASVSSKESSPDASEAAASAPVAGSAPAASSASATAPAANNGSSGDQAGPVGQVLQVLDKKVRNLEKRKVRIAACAMQRRKRLQMAHRP